MKFACLFLIILISFQSISINALKPKKSLDIHKKETSSIASEKLAQSSFQSDVKSFVENYHISSELNDAALNIKSWSFCIIGFIVTAFSIITFKSLQSQINIVARANGSPGSPITTPDTGYKIFDVRNGYTPQVVAAVLQAWGTQGRLLYLLIEAVDVFIYCPSYRATYLVLLNRLYTALSTRIPIDFGGGSGGWIRRLAFLPIILAIVDFIEDFGQVAFTTLYDILPTPIWSLLVRITSQVNKLKWYMVQNISGLALSSTVILVVLLVKEEVEKRTSRSTSRAK